MASCFHPIARQKANVSRALTSNDRHLSKTNAVRPSYNSKDRDYEAFYWQLHLFLKQDKLIGSRKVSQKASSYWRPCLAALEFPEVTVVKKIQGWSIHFQHQLQRKLNCNHKECFLTRYLGGIRKRVWGKGAFQPALHFSSSDHSQHLNAKEIQSCSKLLLPLEGFL